MTGETRRKTDGDVPHFPSTHAARQVLLRVGDAQRVPKPIWQGVLDTCSRLRTAVLVRGGVPPWLTTDAQEAEVSLQTLPSNCAYTDVSSLLARMGSPRVAVSADPDDAAAFAASCLQDLAPRQSSATHVLLDKIEARRAAQRAALHVPCGFTWDPGRPATAAELGALIASSPDGVMIKGSMSWAGQHAAHASMVSQARAAASHIATATGARVSIERFIAGLEYSVELVRFEDGSARVAGWTAKGQSENFTHPLLRARVTPADEPPRGLVVPALRLLQEVGYVGAADFDFIVDHDGVPWFLECNPRSSWSTVLNWTSRGYSCLDMLLDDGENVLVPWGHAYPPARRRDASESPATAIEFLLNDSTHLTQHAIEACDLWVHPPVAGYRARGFGRLLGGVDELQRLSTILDTEINVSLQLHVDQLKDALELTSLL